MITFRVDDMNCIGCASSVTTAVQALDAKAEIQVDLPRKQVRILSAATDERSFRRAITDAGFSPIAVLTNPTARPNPNVCGCKEKCGCA